jgi:hypothetical protein
MGMLAKESPFCGKGFYICRQLIKGQYIVVNQNILACVRGETGLDKLCYIVKKDFPVHFISHESEQYLKQYN